MQNLPRLLTKKKLLLFFIICLLFYLLFVFFKKENADLTSIRKKPNIESTGNQKTHSVEAKIFLPQKKNLVVSTYGLTDSPEKVIVLPEIEGTVINKIVEDGDFVDIDDPIITIDPGAKKAELQEAKEIVEQKKIEYESDKRLKQKDYVSDAKLQKSFAQLKSAESNLKKIEDSLEKNIIKANIRGVVTKIHVSEGDYVEAGKTVITEIIDPTKYTVVCYVSELDLLNLKKGDKALVSMPDNKQLKGYIKYISPISKENTRTFRVEILLKSQDLFLPVGITAKVKIIGKEEIAYKLPETSLYLNDQGLLGIKVIIDKKIKFIPANIIEEDSGNFWVTVKEDLGKEAKVIGLGGNFVKDGQDLPN